MVDELVEISLVTSRDVVRRASVEDPIVSRLSAEEHPTLPRHLRQYINVGGIVDSLRKTQIHQWRRCAVGKKVPIMPSLLNHLGMHSIPLRIALVPIIVAANNSREPWLRRLCIAIVRRSGELVDGKAQWQSCKGEIEAFLIYGSAVEAHLRSRRTEKKVKGPGRPSTYTEGFIDRFRMVAVMCGLDFASTGVVAGAGSVVVFGKVAFIAALLSAASSPKNSSELSSLL